LLAPERIRPPLRGLSFWELQPPMGPSEDPATRSKNQETVKTTASKRPARQPRTRRCLLKGCTRTFRPIHALERYCSEECREQARIWSRWKAQQHYRRSDGGKKKRRAQCRRHRQRTEARKRKKTIGIGGARVIRRKFFRCFLRSPGMLRSFPAHTAIAGAAVLLLRMSTSLGTCSGAGKAVAGTID